MVKIPENIKPYKGLVKAWKNRKGYSTSKKSKSKSSKSKSKSSNASRRKSPNKKAKLMRGLMSAVTGLMAFAFMVKSSTSKYAGAVEELGTPEQKAGYPFNKHGMGDFLANLGLGKIAEKHLGWSGTAHFDPNPLNAINATTIGSGIGAGVVRYVRGYAPSGVARKVVQVIEYILWGMFAGSALGSIFDPDPSKAQGNPNNTQRKSNPNLTGAMGIVNYYG